MILQRTICAGDNSEPLPLMEGEGRSLRVLGFNQNQRTAFVQLMMRLVNLLYYEFYILKTLLLRIIAHFVISFTSLYALLYEATLSVIR